MCPGLGHEKVRGWSDVKVFNTVKVIEYEAEKWNHYSFISDKIVLTTYVKEIF